MQSNICVHVYKSRFVLVYLRTSLGGSDHRLRAVDSTASGGSSKKATSKPGFRVRGLGFRELARNIAKQWQWCYLTVLRRDYGSRLPNTPTALGLLLTAGTCL